MTTSKTRVTLFCQKPFTLYTSSDNSSKSTTLGLLTYAWTIPATQPAARNGFSEVMGAAKTAVRMASGGPKAANVPRAANVPFQSVQLISCCTPAAGLFKRVNKINPIMITVIDQPIIFGHLDCGGFWTSRCKSCSL